MTGSKIRGRPRGLGGRILSWGKGKVLFVPLRSGDFIVMYLPYLPCLCTRYFTMNMLGDLLFTTRNAVIRNPTLYSVRSF